MPDEDYTTIRSKAKDSFFQALNPDSLNQETREQAADPDLKRGTRLNLDQDKVKNGLGQLVLTLVKLIHELLERQAIQRMDSGALSDEQIENVGLTLMRQSEELDRLRREFNLEEEDLNLDLGPLGRLL